MIPFQMGQPQHRGLWSVRSPFTDTQTQPGQAGRCQGCVQGRGGTCSCLSPCQTSHRRKNLAVTSTAGKAAEIIHLLQGLGGAVSPEKGKELLGMEALQGRFLSQGFRRHPEHAGNFYKHHSNPSEDLGSLQDKTWNGFGGKWEERCGVGSDGFLQPGRGTIPVVLPRRNLLLMGTNPHPGGHSRIPRQTEPGQDAHTILIPHPNPCQAL